MSQAGNKVREAKVALYRKQGTIHAKTTRGRFNSLRWGMVWLTQIIFYGTCWLSWRVGDTTRQAVWFDIAHEKLYLFGWVFWPQDALLLAFVLILAATGLFLVTALAGRLFCGFACPQTVYTSLFVWIETQIEGDHLARLKLDQAPASPRKLLLKSIKHGLWLLFAVWTAISFVGYFTPIRELLPALAEGAVGPWESFWLIFYAAFTYVQAGLAREAVCQHMCPYSRFQGVMFDAATRTVSYDVQRGEPRSHRQAASPRTAQPGACIDCGICEQVCPTGIDIRDGLQYQCINCGLCIDACDQVMLKTGAAPGLIRFMSEEEHQGTPPRSGMRQRPRVLIYAALLLVTTLLMAWTLQTRPTLRAEILRDRGALLRESPEGRIENAYTVKILNLAEQPRRVHLTVSGLPGLALVGRSDWPLEPSSILVLSVTVAAPAEGPLRGSQPIRFHVQDDDGSSEPISENSTFILP